MSDESTDTNGQLDESQIEVSTHSTIMLHQPDMREDMIFEDLEPIKVSVTLGSVKYWLVEASGGVVTSYRNKTIAGARVLDGKVSGFGNVADSEPFLLAQCLFIADPKTGELRLDRQGNVDRRFAVSETIIRSWKHVIQKSLFARVKAISQLDDVAETEQDLTRQIANLTRKLRELQAGKAEDEEAKNLLAGTGSGCD